MSHSILVYTSNNIPTYASAYKTEPNNCTNHTKYPKCPCSLIFATWPNQRIICAVTVSLFSFFLSIVYFPLSLEIRYKVKWKKKKKTFHRNLYSRWISHRRRVVCHACYVVIWWMVNALFSFVHFHTSIFLPFTILSFDPSINMVACFIRRMMRGLTERAKGINTKYL